MNAQNGITVGGKALTEYLIEKDDDIKKKESLKDFHQKEKEPSRYYSPRTKVGKKNGRSTITTLLPRRQINREYWRNNMKSKNLKKKTIALLLTGRRIRAKEINDIIREDDNLNIYTHKKDLGIPGILTGLYRSPLQRLMLRKNIAAGKKPIYSWGLVEEAYDMTTDEIYDLANRRNKKVTYDTLTEKYPWMKKYSFLNDEPPVEPENQPDLETEKKVIEILNEDAEESEEISNDLYDLMKQGLEKTLGVKVQVEGSIKILFGFTK